jgi:methionine sulfoxide reductase heme-binding subunit
VTTVPALRRAGEPLGRVLGRRPARLAAWLLGALPAAWLAWQLWLAWNGEDHALGREPVKGLEHRTGDWTIRFLALSLAVTPLRQLAGWNWLAKYRRLFGLLAFGYASAHLATFVALDLELQLGEVAREIVKRPYITVGFAAWLLLAPLAVTSTAGWIRRLGRRWDRLHSAVYVVVALGLVHYWWSQKKDKSDPLLWVAVFALLLGWRAWWKWRGRPPR